MPRSNSSDGAIGHSREIQTHQHRRNPQQIYDPVAVQATILRKKRTKTTGESSHTMSVLQNGETTTSHERTTPIRRTAEYRDEPKRTTLRSMGP